MGLGPHNSSLLNRVDAPLTILDDRSIIADMEKEQQRRNKARLIGRIRYAQKHKKPGKPLAPVEDTGFAVKFGFRRRAWKWVGETILTEGLFTGYCYSTTELRAKGYKLPKLKE